MTERRRLVADGATPREIMRAMADDYEQHFEDLGDNTPPVGLPVFAFPASIQWDRWNTIGNLIEMESQGGRDDPTPRHIMDGFLRRWWFLIQPNQRQLHLDNRRNPGHMDARNAFTIEHNSNEQLRRLGRWRPRQHWTQRPAGSGYEWRTHLRR